MYFPVYHDSWSRNFFYRQKFPSNSIQINNNLIIFSIGKQELLYRQLSLEYYAEDSILHFLFLKDHFFRSFKNKKCVDILSKVSFIATIRITADLPGTFTWSTCWCYHPLLAWNSTIWQQFYILKMLDRKICKYHFLWYITS